MSENNQKVNNYEEIYKKYPQLVDILLLDMTRKHCDFPISSDIRNNVSEKERDKCKYNIIWATDGYTKNILTPLTSTSVGENGYKIVPRCDKAKDEQIKRTKDKAEVFTPSWICNKQNNIIDNQRFLEKGLYTQDEIDKNGIFNKENITHQDVTIKNNTKTIEIHNWDTNENTIKFNSYYKWTDYVNENVIEITCGEAPYLVSRYDTVNGDVIDIKRRIGLLDRKLRIINENAKTDKDWKEWIIKAYRHTYGFEWQGDNLLLARKNLLNTFIDYYYQRFNEFPSSDFLEEIAKIISWNIWQMDGLKGTIPMTCTKPVKSCSKKLDNMEELANDLRQTCPGCAVDPLEGIKNTVKDKYRLRQYNIITKQKEPKGKETGHNGIPCLIRDWDRFEKEEKYICEPFVECVFDKEEAHNKTIKGVKPVKPTKQKEVGGLFKRILKEKS